MYKLICIDMDGTMLNDDKIISKRNKLAIKNAIEKGIKIVVCTGRLHTNAFYYAEILGIKAPIISANGAYIREKDENRIIYKNALSAEECLNIVEILKKYEVQPHFNTSDVVITDKIRFSSEYYTNFNKKVEEKNRIKIIVTKEWEKTIYEYKDAIFKCIAAADNLENLKKARIQLEKLDKLTVVSSLSTNIEVMHKGVSKGTAVEVLSNYYGIDRKDVICIGDNENDISMLKFAGMSVAMGNASEEVKAIADYITDTNNNDGVGKAIEKIVLR